jgi:cytochrome c-type biogenesis protein CcmH
MVFLLQRCLLVITWLIVVSGGAAAREYGETLKNPELEARARRLYTEIRCPVCAGQSLDSSQSQVAADLRADIRARLLSGQSDTEIIDALKARYGQAVSFCPTFCLQTLLLWGVPFLLIGLGILMLWRLLRRRRLMDERVVLVVKRD